MTVTIWIPDKSGIGMVQACLVVNWSGFLMVVWKPDKKCLCYCLKCSVFEWCTISIDPTIWKLGKKSVSKVKCLDFRCLVFRWLMYLFENGTKSVRKVKCLDLKCLLFRWLLSQISTRVDCFWIKTKQANWTLLKHI